MKRVAAFVLVCTTLFMGCGKQATDEQEPSTDEIDIGVVEDSVYRNDYFGLSISLPMTWYVLDKNAQRTMINHATEKVVSDEKHLASTLEAIDRQTVNLFAVFRYPGGSPRPFNPGMICTAEKVDEIPGIERGSDYLNHGKSFLLSNQVDVAFPSVVYPKTLGGLEFDVMPVNVSDAGKTTKRRFYATITKGYALVFMVVYSTDQEESMLEYALDTVEFQLQ